MASISAAGTNGDSAAGTPSLRWLLGCGLVAGPFYLAVGLGQAFIREGFVFSRHPLSVLSNGPGGWIQIANFALTGLMVIAAALGMRRVLGPKSKALQGFLSGYGASIFLAAIFRADPMDGFPVGTAVGPPTSISTSGLLHFAVGGIGFLCLAVSCFLAARAMSRRNDRSMARLSFWSGLIVAVGFFGTMAIPNASPVLGIWIAVVVGWAWLSILSRRLALIAAP
ncbi:MAG TPA: DUF998 domain-containing protein [Steroidobacteraceae bacterium]|jgi:hypothetical protein